MPESSCIGSKNKFIEAASAPSSFTNKLMIYEHDESVAAIKVTSKSEIAMPESLPPIPQRMRALSKKAIGIKQYNISQ